MKLKLTVLFIILLGLSQPAYPKSRGNYFIAPSKSICLRYGGSWERHFKVCEASWTKAKKICRASRGRLPSINEFYRVVRSCGGVPSSKLGNKVHHVNSQCYWRLGIDHIGSEYYWSSTPYHSPSLPSYMFKKTMYISIGISSIDDIGSSHFITCIR